MFELLRRSLRRALLKIELVVIAAIYALSWIVAGLAVYQFYRS
jgi:hypothetical protein